MLDEGRNIPLRGFPEERASFPEARRSTKAAEKVDGGDEATDAFNEAVEALSAERDPSKAINTPEIDFLGENTEQLMMRVRYMVDKATPKKGDKARLKNELNTPEEIADPNMPFHLEGETHFDALTRNAVNQVSESTEGDRLATFVFGPTITTGEGAKKVTKQKPATMEHFSYQDITESLGPEAENIIRAIPKGTTVGGQTRGAQGRQLLTARKNAAALKKDLRDQVASSGRQAEGFTQLRPDKFRPSSEKVEQALRRLSSTNLPEEARLQSQLSFPLGESEGIAGSTSRQVPDVVGTLTERSKRATSQVKQRPGVSQRQVLDTQIKNRLRRQAEGRQGVKKGLLMAEQRAAARRGKKKEVSGTTPYESSPLDVLKARVVGSKVFDADDIETAFRTLMEQGMDEMQAFEYILGIIGKN